MKKTKSNLDELQELKLLKIEHNGCWLAFWGLLAVILTQIAIGNDSKQDLSGEWIVFMCLALYLTVGCIRNGIWDRKLKPNFKNNIMASSIAAVVMGILWFIISYRNYHKLVGSIATGVIMFFSIEILCFLALTLTSKIYKKRECSGLEALRAILLHSGWTTETALCMMALCLLHFPCGTTCLTIRRETGSRRWTLLAMVLCSNV